MLRYWRDILSSLAERWEDERNHVESMEKIRAKAVVFRGELL
jgi:hypothetical protein